MDVLRYTGEDGKRWPATAGAQEDQRRAYRLRPGLTTDTTMSTATPSRPAAFEHGGSGRRGFEHAGTGRGREDGRRTPDRWRRKSLRVRVPGRRGTKTLTATFTNRSGGVVAKLRFRARTGSARRFNLTVAGVPGTYRYIVRVGDSGKVLGSGVARVSTKSVTGLRVADGRTLVCRIR